VTAAYALAVPVAVYLLSVWVLHIWPQQPGPSTVAFPVAAALVLLTPLTPAPVHLTAALLAALVAATVVTSRVRSVPEPGGGAGVDGRPAVPAQE
jgi:hypothetical protein